MPDIRITPSISTMAWTSSLNFKETITQDVSGSLVLYGSGSTGRTTLFGVDGNNGRLFEISDDLSDSLFSVNTIAGLPVIEAFADNRVVMGEYGKNAFTVSGSGANLSSTSGSMDMTKRNTVFGVDGLKANATGKSNTVIGYKNITVATGSAYNIAVGYKNFYDRACVGVRNIAVGYCNWGFSSIYTTYKTGQWNVGVGTRNFTYSNGTGCRNVGIGSYNLQKLTSGNWNVAIGTETGYCLTTGCNNVLMGKSAGTYMTTGFKNVNIGYFAGNKLTSGYRNVAIGENALQNMVGGYRNVAIGDCAGRNMAGDGRHTVSIGPASARCSNTVARNIAIGYRAFEYAKRGQQNIAIGSYALSSNTATPNWAATGLYYNVAVGSRSLNGLQTGYCNTAIGYGSQNQSMTAINNTIAVGYNNNTSAASHHTIWGNSSNNVCNCIYVAWSVVSDCRDKANITPLPEELGLDFIKKLKPVFYNWDNRETYETKCKYPYGQKDGSLTGTKQHYGLIAQDIKKALDELNVRFDALGHDEKKDAYRINYEELIPSIIKSIQELSNRVETLEAK